MYRSKNTGRGGEADFIPAGAYRGRMSADNGPEPFTLNISRAAEQNGTFRTTVWTGEHLQVTLMCIPAGGEVGLEMHPRTDQFIRVETGRGLVQMGNSRDDLGFQRIVCDGYAILIPAGKWHNLLNTGRCPLKLYSIYAPPHHPQGTVHLTKADSDAAEHG